MRETNIQRNPNDRVRKYGPVKFNDNIDRKTNQVLFGIVSQGPEAIKARLQKLDKEWDIDRALMMILSGAIISEVTLAYRKQSKKLLWPALIQAPFLFMHATFGWSPPVILLRKLGFRTRFEIQNEREILLEFLYDADVDNVWDENSVQI